MKYAIAFVLSLLTTIAAADDIIGTVTSVYSDFLMCDLLIVAGGNLCTMKDA